MWVIFALLDPDQDSEYGSGSTGPIEYGSNPDPDPKPWKKDSLFFIFVPVKVEVPFSFSLCVKSFALKAGLQKQTRIHTDEKPYSGPPFKKVFAVICALKSHLKCTLA